MLYECDVLINRQRKFLICEKKVQGSNKAIFSWDCILPSLLLRIQRKRVSALSLPVGYSSTWIVVSLTDSTPFWDMRRSANVLIIAPSP